MKQVWRAARDCVKTFVVRSQIWHRGEKSPCVRVARIVEYILDRAALDDLASGSLDPSHVLLAIGLPHEIAHGSLRLTLSAETTMEQIDFTVDCLKKIVERLRSMSPLYEDYIKKHPQQ